MPAPTAPTAPADATRTRTRTVRLGVHGSTHLASRLVAAAGHAPESVEYVPYEVTAPFAPLRAGEADIMIVKYDPLEPDLALSRPVGFDGRAVLVGAHHPLAGRASVSVEEVAEYGGFRCPGAFPAHVWNLVVPPRTPLGRPIRRVHAMTTLTAMAELLRSTYAIHLSFRSLEAVVPPDIKVVPVHDLPPSPVAFAWLRGAEPPEHVRRFVADAQRAALR
ncbi:LysR family transcriptional regulator substrate-binding protein [Streptomyces roseus]|uniref:LysR family transcriptional regulator n=1 Tax=Streptomyces roseus TaxID=66430 RepID=A0A0J6XSM1_9ACTN|nr:LysR family transcriptional regulator substrate-binding protein [Streptomyces roseus]KMO97763.1 LysR family transcriptional regulator [Streptomyces roseus]